VLERALAEHDIDTVFHLGAQTQVGAASQNPLETFEANIRGTYNLMEACRRAADRISSVVVASSDKAYGNSDVLPYEEGHPLQGRYPYDVSKSCTDLITQAYYWTYGLPVAIARCGNVYGGGDLNWERIVPGTIRSFIRGKRPVIRSDGKLTRDYLFVDDVVEAYQTIAAGLYEREELRGEAFNFGPGQPTSVLDMVAEIAAIMETPELLPDIRDGASGEIPHQHLHSGKAAEMLNWRTRSGLRQGLTSTIDWYRRYLEA
jgi:CDP-glucose 4,6-dehydratase